MLTATTYQVKKSNITLVVFLNSILVNWLVLEEVDRVGAGHFPPNVIHVCPEVHWMLLKVGQKVQLLYSLYVREKTGNCRVSAQHLTI